MELPFMSKKSTEKSECHQDEAGNLICRRFREFEDGTKSELAGVDFSFDGQCQPVSSNLWENEKGQLDKLEKWALPRLKTKCKNTPPHY